MGWGGRGVEREREERAKRRENQESRAEDQERTKKGAPRGDMAKMAVLYRKEKLKEGKRSPGAGEV